jgi:hypothetical protein
MYRMMTIAVVVAALSSAALAADPCRAIYLLGEAVPPGCALLNFQQWGAGRPAVTVAPATGPTLPLPRGWQVTCDKAGRCAQ